MTKEKLMAAKWLQIEEVAHEPAVQRYARLRYQRCMGPELESKRKMTTVTSSGHPKIKILNFKKIVTPIIPLFQEVRKEIH